MEKTVLELNNVSKYFKKTKVINSINLTVQEGEIFGFLGPNGAGKTTKRKMILGLLSIDEGNIKINGYDVKNDFEKAMEYIGGIVENPDLYGYMSGYNNLKLHARMRNVTKSRIDEVVKLVNLSSRINDKVSKYSLGMKQRLGLAVTLLHSPKILILDEPTNGLDPAGIKDFRTIIQNISKEDKIAVFVSSHILSEMQAMCNKIAVLDKGTIIDVENLSESESHQEKDLLNYSLNVDNISKAEKIITSIVDDIKIENNYIKLLATKDSMAQIINNLVKVNIKVYSASRKEKTLEDTFFDVTKRKEPKND